MRVSLLVGTIKGGFLLHSNADRAEWSVEGPFFKGWKVTASGRDAAGGYLLATASDVYGPAVHKSPDLVDWHQVASGPAYSEASGHKLNQVWTFGRAGQRLLAGVDEAGLFSSEDGGENWSQVESLTSQPSRPQWYPGFGGLCAHHLLSDPKNPDRLWVAISAVGVFRSDDGGASWQGANEGVPCIIQDEQHCEIGYCVHALQQHPEDANTIFRQDHRGMFKSTDGGEQWREIQEGLPSNFGFPLVMDQRTRALYCCPLESDEYRFPVDGALRVYRSTDEGESWEPMTEGLPQSNAYVNVLRCAMACDSLPEGGVYMGTTAGQLYVSTDGGARWRDLGLSLPRILSVEVYVAEEA